MKKTIHVSKVEAVLGIALLSLLSAAFSIITHDKFCLGFLSKNKSIQGSK
jgi:CRISPR/Cas system-associated endonuclease Cas1